MFVQDSRNNRGGMYCIVFAQDGRGMGQGWEILENRVCMRG